MTEEKKSKFTVITNRELDNQVKPKPEPNKVQGYQTNPFYERLVKFSNDKHRKRFSIEDLLR